MMKKNHNDSKGVYYAPLERSFELIFTPFEIFVRRQTSSALILILTTIVALVLANSIFSETYYQISHIKISFSIGKWDISKTFLHWINDGLMAFFFFVVGLELKRELLTGELSSPRKAALPIFAAIGGMIVPALIYFSFNPEGVASRGWGIPMATDIAFAIGILVLLGKRAPPALMAFLVALAIADDLGAVIIIALFYSDSIVTEALWFSAAITGILIIFNYSGIRRPIPYFILAVFLWFSMLYSGIHPTLAGIIGAFTVPSRPKYDPVYFSDQIKELTLNFDTAFELAPQITKNASMKAIVQEIEDLAHKVMTPLQRLEYIWHLPVAYLVIPLFALFNAGIEISIETFMESLMHPVMLGVMFGLVFGKLIGITGFCWIALKLGIAQLPTDTTFSQVTGVAFLAGIGFTMSIFITQLAFLQDNGLITIAKTGILSASLISGIIGFVWLWISGRKIN